MSKLADRIAALSPEQRRLLHRRLREQRSSGVESGSSMSIPRRGERDTAPVSYAQERFWFLSKFEPESSAYHIPLILGLGGVLNLDALTAALSRLRARHASLRTVFVEKDGEIRQRVLPSDPVQIPVIDLSMVAEEEKRNRAEDAARDIARRPFDLEESPARFELVRLSADEHWLVSVFHHIVADGWSIDVFQEELLATYAAAAEGRRVELPELPIQYTDFAEWQREQLQGERLKRKVAHWRDRLSGAPSMLDLPTDRPRPAIQSYRGTYVHTVVRRRLVERLERIGKHHDASVFMVLLASLNILLSRTTGQTDICIGSPIAARTRTEIERLMGVFINTLVLRTDLSGSPSFTELLLQVRRSTLEAFSHQDLPFEKLVEELSPTRALSHSPLFQVMLLMHAPPLPPTRMANLEVRGIFVDTGNTMFDLGFYVYDHEDGLGLTLQYATDLFDASTVARMAEQLKTLLASIANGPERSVSELDLLPEAERRTLVEDWNETAMALPQECVHAAIEAQATRTPNAIAVSMGSDALSYAELDMRSNRLARYLTKLGVRLETPVGVCVTRAPSMLVALLGVLKASGAYLPLDPSFPRERLSFMVRDAGARVIVTQASLRDAWREHEGLACVSLDADAEAVGRESGAAVSSAAQPDSLAYVIYTSGSTGRPKGVQIEHSSLTNLLYSMLKEPGVAPEDRLLAVTTLSFDIAAPELFLPLLVGARVVVASREDASDGKRLAALMASEQVSVMQATPSTWRMLAESGWKGDARLKALCGGEALTRELADELLERTGSLWNVYGPTETTIWSTLERVEPGTDSITVGRPLGNTSVYLLDEHRQLVPMGAYGELCIGGAGVARGYQGRDSLAAERFITNPFGPDPIAVSGSSVFRTGDIARYRPDGRLEVAGRIDHQVKIRGFRIELGEIESVLDTQAKIKQAVVVVREDTVADKRLVAYFVSNGDSIPSVTELREHLTKKLPDYMLPTAFVELDTFPLTLNGKVDRNELPAPEDSPSKAQSEYVAPRTPIEEKLAEIWKDLLGLDRVGAGDNFFELGGHSLMAVRLFNRIEERFGFRLPLATLFQSASLGELATAVGEATEASWSCLVPIQRGRRDIAPFFCIHAEGGEVLFYRDFARLLDAGQPVYGLQAQALDGRSPPLESIEEMASRYIAEIRQIQPAGPYYLGGHCYGGVIMFEMAQQLYRQHERVALMAMMDSSPARIHTTLADKLRYAAHALRRSPVALLKHIVTTEIGARLRFRALDARAGLGREPDGDLASSHARVGEAIARAYMMYVPEIYPGRITYFMNSERARLGHLKWRELAAGGLELHTFPGTPNTTFVSPSVEALADGVRASLVAARSTSGECEATT